MMYRRIILAYDGTLDGRTALREGALLALKCNAQVFLLSVLTGSMGIDVADSVHSGSASQKQSADFEAVLADGAARLRELGMQPVTRLVKGEPAIEIRNLAKEVAADLVVVSHRRQTLLARWWSGSSGAYILDNIDCSLLVARNQISDEDFETELRDMVAPVQASS
jgi:nucleotide-binding universal stress UspA family protein